MKAMRLLPPGGLDHLVAVTEPRPAPPGPGEIGVRIHASSLNFHDHLVVVGARADGTGLIPLSDASAEVVAIGEGVDHVAVGDHVISLFFPSWRGGRINGGMAGVPGDGFDGYAREYATVKADAFTPAPRGMSHIEAATISCAGVTAWRALFAEGRLEAGDVVLVQGSGGVSLFALQFAKAAGATVVAISSSDQKLERLRRLGADLTINYRETPDWAKAVVKALGRGVDHVVDVGGGATIAQSVAACRDGGHIAVIGILGGLEGGLSIRAVMLRQLRLTGLTVGHHEHQRATVAAVETHGIRPVIDRAYSLDALPDAFRRMQNAAHFGKIAVTI